MRVGEELGSIVGTILGLTWSNEGSDVGSFVGGPTAGVVDGLFGGTTSEFTIDGFFSYAVHALISKISLIFHHEEIVILELKEIMILELKEVYSPRGEGHILHNQKSVKGRVSILKNPTTY